MTTRYFAVNSLAGCKRSSTSVVEDTTAGRFDSSYVANAIKVPNSSEYWQIDAPFLDGSTSVSTLWTRLDGYISIASTSTVPVLWLNSGVNAYRILTAALGSNQFQMQYWNSGTSAWVSWGSAFTCSNGALATLVVKIVCGSSYSAYVGGTLLASDGGTTPTNPQSAITTIRGTSANNAGASYFSQIMGADYDIRDAKFMAQVANGNGANTDGSGAYTDINETVLDESTAISLPAVNNKKTFTKASITVPGGYVIAGLVISARGRVSGGTVTDGKLVVRSGGTDYASSGKSYNGGYEPRSGIWTTDPATSSAFSQSGYNSAEFGVQAA